MSKYSEENGNSVMARFRVPKDIYNTLAIEAIRRDMKPTRFIIELLRTTSDKIKQRDAEFDV